MSCILATGIAVASHNAHGQPVDDCAVLQDADLRLDCYDRFFRGGEPGAQPASDSAAIDDDLPGAEPIATDTSLVSKLWELERSDKRGTFIVRTYLPNYVLPLYFTSNINRAPSSPTHPASEYNDGYRNTETSFQISLRAKIVENLLLPQADLWFAYTQRSHWQIWSQQDSSPFRSTDYQPELIYVMPVSPELRTLPAGWEWRMLEVGVAHQSNGQRAPLSRSWNRAYIGTVFERRELAIQLLVHQRIGEPDVDDSPDLTEYIGRGEITAVWLPGYSTLALTWRTDFRSWNRGSLTLDWTHPVDNDQPIGLRWHVRLFSGYGDTLLDYNHRQASIGLGLMLFQF